MADALDAELSGYAATVYSKVRAGIVFPIGRVDCEPAVATYVVVFSKPSMTLSRIPPGLVMKFAIPAQPK